MARSWRSMAAAQGFRSGWWEAYGYIMCPSMYQRAKDAVYWDTHDAIDREKWKTAGMLAVQVGINAKEVSRVLRLLVKDGEIEKRGRKYRHL